MAKLLSRDEFRMAVLDRSAQHCVNCQASATCAHHIVERHLFEDGGYYLDNGAALCDPCHWLAEKTILSVEKIRELAGVRTIVVPPGFDPEISIDKWGNRVISEHMRELGPMADHEGMLKILRPQALVLLDKD